MALFEREMTVRKADWQVNIYSNVEHAFSVPGQPRYNKKIAERSWKDMLFFLKEAFA